MNENPVENEMIRCFLCKVKKNHIESCMYL